MKKLRFSYLLIALLIVAALTPASVAARSPQSQAGPNSVAGSTVTNVSPNPVIIPSPPLTLDPFNIIFTVNFASPDGEWMDRFDIDLPDDWGVELSSPLTNPPPPNTVCLGTMKGITGNNIVYWQTTAPMPSGCGPWDVGAYTFRATVTIADCASEPWTLHWNIYGDGVGGLPNAISGNYVLDCSADFLWTGTMNNDWFNTGNWSPLGVPSGAISDNATIPTGVANNPIISGDATVNSLVMQPGTTLTVNGAANLTVNGDLLMDDGSELSMGTGKIDIASTDGLVRMISSHQDVTGAADFTFLGTIGVVINPGASLPLGDTFVRIQEHSACTNDITRPSLTRCFFISPTNTTGRNATIKFFFNDSHLNGLNCLNLKVWHWSVLTGWSLAGDGGSVLSCNPGAESSITVTGVSDFSPFVITDAPAGPTAISLENITLRSANTWLPAGLLAFGLLASSALLYLARRKKLAS